MLRVSAGKKTYDESLVEIIDEYRDIHGDAPLGMRDIALLESTAKEPRSRIDPAFVPSGQKEEADRSAGENGPCNARGKSPREHRPKWKSGI